MDVELEEVGAVLQVLDVEDARHVELGIESCTNYSRLFLKALPRVAQKLLNGPIWTTGSASGWETSSVGRRLNREAVPVSLPIGQTLTLFLSPLCQLGPQYLAKARFSFPREKGEEALFFSWSAVL